MYLVVFNHLLQDDAPALEITTRRGLGVGRYGFAAHVVRAVLVHRAAAFRAGTQIHRVAKLHNLAALGVFVVAEVKLQLPVFVFVAVFQCDFSGERPTGFRAETIERTDFFVM